MYSQDEIRKYMISEYIENDIENDIEGTPMVFLKDYKVVSILYYHRSRFKALLVSEISDMKIVAEKNLDGSISYSIRR